MGNAEKESELLEAAKEKGKAEEYLEELQDCRKENEALKKEIEEVLRHRLQDVLNERRKNVWRTKKRRELPKQEDYGDLIFYLEACLDFAMYHHTQGRKSKVFAAALVKVFGNSRAFFCRTWS